MMAATSVNAGRGEFVPQGKCKECNKDWGMYQNEIDFFKTLQKTDQKIQLPKRCSECRKKKKTADISGVITGLEAIAEKSRMEAFYTYKEDQLADELLEHSNTLRRYLGAKKAD
jgi:hypothetical protein